MGYSADVVRGYGVKVNTCDLEYNGDPEGILERWWEAEEQYGGHAGKDGLRILMAGDSRAPMPNQALMLVFEDSVRAGEDYSPSLAQLRQLEAVVAQLGLKVDEGPAFFQDTFIT